MSGCSEYNAWIGMKMRCLNPKNKRYADYGGRGIGVCEEWVASFEAFLNHIGPKPASNYSLDRLDVDGDYRPGNVRWADPSTQMKNRRPFLMRPGSAKGATEATANPAYVQPTQPRNLHHNATHGMSNTPEYRAWRSMKKRCLNPSHRAYRNYGGRGVAVHPAWITSFLDFLCELGMKPGPGYSLDRIDNDRGYVPGNVRWADTSCQNSNRRAFMIAPKV